ncbi:YrhC family protein [Bacillus sp. CGMCC 1.16541]|uniref:YrhC family protein n=1 Tax=Bacillus sp. CGMCC 1.16541 TaxID=2185143 RepID=UPI000D72750B|nr:YrhC family protein [Bacillus sp. CGMCC 1.16541]
MKNTLTKKIEAKIEDYRRFIYVLLSISTFLYIGILIGNGEKAELQLNLMMGVIVLLLGAAFFFAFKVKQLKNELLEKEES